MDPNVEAVKSKMDARSIRGLQKYGRDTTRTDLTTAEWLQHAQEEAMDLAIYLERLIGENNTLEIEQRSDADER